MKTFIYTSAFLALSALVPFWLLREKQVPLEETRQYLLKQYPMVVSIDPAGRRILLKSRGRDDYHLLLHDLRSGATTTIDRSPHTQLSLTWHPTRSLLAFQESPQGKGRFSLHVLDLETGARRKLEAPESQHSGARVRWSPAGTQLAFLRVDTVTADLMTVGLEPGSRAEIRLKGVSLDADFDWSPKGKWLVAIPATDRGALEFLSLATGKSARRRLFPEGEIRHLAWSPDEKSLALGAREKGGEYFEIYRWELASQELTLEQREPRDLPRPIWLGDQLAVHEGNDEVLNVRDGNIVQVREKSPWAPPTIAIFDAVSGKIGGRYRFHSPEVGKAIGPIPVEIAAPIPGGKLPAHLWRDTSQKTKALIIALQGGLTPAIKDEWNAGVQWLAQRGVAYLGVTVRGAQGHGATFEREKGLRQHLLDAKQATSFAVELAAEWGAKPYVYGSSYGAYLALCALMNEPKVLGAFLVAFPDMFPKCWSEERTVRILSFHGENDAITSPEAAMAWFQSQLSFPVRQIRLPREGHNFHGTDSWAEVYARILSVIE